MERTVCLGLCMAPLRAALTVSSVEQWECNGSWRIWAGQILWMCAVCCSGELQGSKDTVPSTSGPYPTAAPLKRKKLLCHCSCCSFSLAFLCPCENLVDRENPVSALPVPSKACPCPVCSSPTSASAAAAGHVSVHVPVQPPCKAAAGEKC